MSWQQTNYDPKHHQCSAPHQQLFTFQWKPALCICAHITLHHAPVRSVCNGVDVWRHLVSLLSFVHVDNLLRVDRQVFIGINDHTEQPRVSLHTKHTDFPFKSSSLTLENNHNCRSSPCKRLKAYLHR